MIKVHRYLAAIALGAALTTSAVAQMSGSGLYGDEQYRPDVGQEGKDVIWVPTNDELVNKMLETAKVTSDDIVYDLGAGDGKIPIAAARKYGVRAVGIEFNPDMAALATRNAKRAGVADKVKIINGDIFKEDFSEATVITLYLLPDLNLKLRPTILKMKPGTRVVSHAFTMGDWEADQRIDTPIARAYYWVVPANVAGTWQLEEIDGQKEKITLKLDQRYQKIGGTITVGNKSQPILGASITGDRLAFSYVDDKGNILNVKSTVKGDTLSGDYESGIMFSKLKGTRR
jgi:SAM-dependent methyltransferase